MRSLTKGIGIRARRFFGRLAVTVAGLSPVLLLGMPSPAGALPPSTPALGAYTTDGPVQAIASAGGRTYIGGAFSWVGRRSGSGVVLSPTGAAESTPEVEVAGGDVYAAISDHNGGWYIGGSFTHVGGAPHAGLAHLHDAYSVDPSFNVTVADEGGAPAPVYALALSPLRADGDRTLYVGGEFRRIGAGSIQARRNLAALTASNGAVNANFSTITNCAPAQHPACDGAVRALALTSIPVNGGSDQPVLFVGGDFTRIGSLESARTVKGAAAIWGLGATDPTDVPLDGEVVTDGTSAWAPQLTAKSDSDPLSASVRTIEVGESSEAKCAEFGLDAARTCSYLAVYLGGWSDRDETGSRVVGPIARAYRFLLDKDARVIRGDLSQQFDRWQTKPVGCSNCAVNSMLLHGGRLYFAGAFSKVGDPSVDAHGLASIEAIPHPQGPANTTFAANAAPFGGGVTGGGGSTAAVRSLARSATSATTILAAGDFSEPRRHIVAFDTTSKVAVPDWGSPLPDSPVSVLATDADGNTSSIYAGGEFRSLGAVSRQGLAAFDSAGALLDWKPDLNGDASEAPRIHALAASSDVVYVGGQFGVVQGGANLAAVDAHSDKVTPLPAATLSSGSPDVLSLAVLGSTLYVGGAFDRLGDQAHANLAAVDVGTGAARPEFDRGVTGSQAAVRAIVPACGAVYVGGWFDQAGGLPRANLAALDPGTGAATGWNPRPDGAVLALARSGPTIYAGGTFGHIAGAERRKLAGLNVSDGLVIPFDAGIDTRALGSSVRALAVSASTLYVGGVFADLRGTPRSHLAAVDPGTGQVLEWDPAVGRPDRDVRVDALALGDDALYAGGTFGSIGATAQRGLARFGARAGEPAVGGVCQRPTSLPGSSPAPAPSNGAGPTSPPPSRSGGRPPGLSGVVLRPTRLFGRNARLSVSFRLTRAARVRLRFDRRVRRRCPAGSRRRVCFRNVRFADVIVRGRRGVNRVTFTALRVGGRRLAVARYRLQLVPLPVARATAPRFAYFQVMAGRRRTG